MKLFRLLFNYTHSYEAQCARTRQDLTIAQSQLREYEARLGMAFPHEVYVTALTELRDRLKAMLANPAEHGAEIAALAGQITTLKAAQTIEAAPERHTPRAATTAAESVTTRLRQRIQEAPVPEPVAQPLVPVTVAKPPQVPVPVAPFQATQPSLFAAPLPRSGKPKSSYQQRVAREERPPAGQLRLL